LSQELYEQPRSEISQGDILELAPHFYLDPPLQAVHLVEEKLHKSEIEPFTTFNDAEGQNIIARGKRFKALVLTPDCEIDKVGYWHVCPVVPLSRLKSGMQGDVKRNRVYKMFFLPAYREVLPDSFVDFNQISTLGMDFVKTAKRVLSLSDLGRQGLYAQFVRWLTRWELKELDCPHCRVKFNPVTSLPVRSG